MADKPDYLSPEDRKILNFALQNLNLSSREVAERFGVTKEHVQGILQRDLSEVMRG